MLRWIIIIVAALMGMGCLYTASYIGRPWFDIWWYKDALTVPIETTVTAATLLALGFICLAIAWVTKQEG